VFTRFCSIEGEGCNLEVLSALSETTGGSVLNVNPADLTKNFSRYQYTHPHTHTDKHTYARTLVECVCGCGRVGSGTAGPSGCVASLLTKAGLQGKEMLVQGDLEQGLVSRPLVRCRFCLAVSEVVHVSSLVCGDPLPPICPSSSILSQTIVASLVSIRLLLHSALKFENEEGVTGNKVSKEIGNVTADTQLSFECVVGSACCLCVPCRARPLGSPLPPPLPRRARPLGSPLPHSSPLGPLYPASPPFTRHLFAPLPPRSRPPPVSIPAIPPSLQVRSPARVRAAPRGPGRPNRAALSGPDPVHT
jgi:hypothetical protein